MRKRTRVTAFLLSLLLTLPLAAACRLPGVGGGGTESGTADRESATAGDTGEWDSGTSGGGESGERAPIPSVPEQEGVTEIDSARLLELIRGGSLTANDRYLVRDGEPIVLGSADRGKTYDLGGATLFLAVRPGEIGIDLRSREITLKNGHLTVWGGSAVGFSSGARECVLSELTVGGDCEAAITVGGKQSRVLDCTVTGGALQVGILVTGTDASVTGCTVEGAVCGLSDVGENGAVFEGNTLRDCTTGIRLQTTGGIARRNTVTGGTVGILSEGSGAEISAARASLSNILIAQNEITGAAISVRAARLSNAVLLLNRADTLEVQSCINAYAVRNRIGDTLTLREVNYLIADGNECGRIVSSGNMNVNGDDLTDVDARETVGVKTELLPHVNSEQFVEMARTSSVRSAEGSMKLQAYIDAQLAAGETDIILPPGAYSFDGIKLSGKNGITLWGYGALAELGISKSTSAYTFESCTDCSVRGLFLGVALYAHTQGTVTKVTQSALGSGRVDIQFVCDPGYRQDFADQTYFGATAPGFWFSDGRLFPDGDFSYNAGAKSYNGSTNTNTIKGVTSKIKVGDRLALRSNFSARGLEFLSCSGMLVEDVTVFSSSGFAEYDLDNDIAPTLHRFAVAAGPAPVLDADGDYSDFESLLWRDTYGRLRSAEPLFTSCDATHSVNERHGLQIVSSLFERLNDDAGNINATYGLASSFDVATNTLTYTTGNVNTYTKLPGTFRVGDTVVLFTWSGKLIWTGKVSSATASIGNNLYTVQLPQSITLPTNERVVVQNASASGAGFLIDNVLVRQVGCNGFRIKAPSGEIRNSSFIQVSKGGINCIPEYKLWPECGFITEGLRIVNNVFRETGLTTKDKIPGSDPLANTVWCAPIIIRSDLYGSNAGEADFKSDSAYLLHQNIEISGNLFLDRYAPYALVMGGVKNVTVSGNTFGDCSVDGFDALPPILLLGGDGIEIRDNDYADAVRAPYEIWTVGQVGSLTCTDRTNGG